MRKLPCVLCLALLPLSAGAADWHLGAVLIDDLDGRTPDIGGAPIETESGFGLLGGVRFDGGFGVEAAWSDLGEARVSAVADAGYTVDGELFSVGLSFAPDFGPVQPFAKLGWFSRSEDGIAIGLAGPSPISFDDDGLMAEIGGRWFVGEQFALRAGYSWYDFDPDADGSLQLGLEWHFR